MRDVAVDHHKHQKIRLLLTAKCDRSCRLCVNRGYDLTRFPECHDLSCYSEIILTGGEPLLEVARLIAAVKWIRKSTDAPIFLYTASRSAVRIISVMNLVNGLTLTLHDQRDSRIFLSLHELLSRQGYDNTVPHKHLRVKVFDGVKLPPGDYHPWNVISTSWVENCPLPENEVFMRVPPNYGGDIVKEGMR